MSLDDFGEGVRIVDTGNCGCCGRIYGDEEPIFVYAGMYVCEGCHEKNEK